MKWFFFLWLFAPQERARRPVATEVPGIQSVVGLCSCGGFQRRAYVTDTLPSVTEHTVQVADATQDTVTVPGA